MYATVISDFEILITMCAGQKCKGSDSRVEREAAVDCSERETSLIRLKIRCLIACLDTYLLFAKVLIDYDGSVP